MSKSPDAFRTISEVAEWLDVQAHVLRFWESKFTQVKPVKRAGGRRYYRPADMLLLGGIQHLLHDESLSVKDVQALIREHGVSYVQDKSKPLSDDEEAEQPAASPKSKWTAPKDESQPAAPTAASRNKGEIAPAAVENDAVRPDSAIAAHPPATPAPYSPPPSAPAPLQADAAAQPSQITTSQPTAPQMPTAAQVSPTEMPSAAEPQIAGTQAGGTQPESGISGIPTSTQPPHESTESLHAAPQDTVSASEGTAASTESQSTMPPAGPSEASPAPMSSPAAQHATETSAAVAPVSSPVMSEAVAHEAPIVQPPAPQTDAPQLATQQADTGAVGQIAMPLDAPQSAAPAPTEPPHSLSSPVAAAPTRSEPSSQADFFAPEPEVSSEVQPEVQKTAPAAEPASAEPAPQAPVDSTPAGNAERTTLTSDQVIPEQAAPAAMKQAIAALARRAQSKALTPEQTPTAGLPETGSSAPEPNASPAPALGDSIATDVADSAAEGIEPDLAEIAPDASSEPLLAPQPEPEANMTVASTDTAVEMDSDAPAEMIAELPSVEASEEHESEVPANSAPETAPVQPDQVLSETAEADAEQIPTASLETDAATALEEHSENTEQAAAVPDLIAPGAPELQADAEPLAETPDDAAQETAVASEELTGDAMERLATPEENSVPADSLAAEPQQDEPATSDPEAAPQQTEQTASELPSLEPMVDVEPAVDVEHMAVDPIANTDPVEAPETISAPNLDTTADIAAAGDEVAEAQEELIADEPDLALDAMSDAADADNMGMANDHTDMAEPAPAEEPTTDVTDSAPALSALDASDTGEVTEAPESPMQDAVMEPQSPRPLIIETSDEVDHEIAPGALSLLSGVHTVPRGSLLDLAALAQELKQLAARH